MSLLNGRFSKSFEWHRLEMESIEQIVTLPSALAIMETPQFRSARKSDVFHEESNVISKGEILLAR